MQNKKKSNLRILHKYLQKHSLHYPFIKDKPEADLGIIAVIPSYNEPNILRCFQSIENCYKPKQSVEIIIVINSHEHSDYETIKTNNKTKQTIIDWKQNNRNYKYHIIHIQDVPTKYAGVGYVRKLGMDEAVSRFMEINNNNGIICSLDADTVIADNYFIEIEKCIGLGSKYNACSIYYEHDIAGLEFNNEVYRRITEYELHLRYYSLSLRHIGFPYYYHTIGSAFAVDAQAYCMQGGMNKKQAGEDFYFLQKIMQMGKFCRLNSTAVYPSPRPSDRVIFGTGPIIRKYLAQKDTEFTSYNFNAFITLKQFFEDRTLFFKLKDNNFDEITSNYHESLRDFLRLNDFKSAMNTINANIAKKENFNRKFYHWFDGLRVVKYMNFAHEQYFVKTPIRNCINDLLSATNNEQYFANAQEMLLYIRQSEKEIR